jgi:hypothetical protein
MALLYVTLLNSVVSICLLLNRCVDCYIENALQFLAPAENQTPGPVSIPTEEISLSLPAVLTEGSGRLESKTRRQQYNADVAEDETSRDVKSGWELVVVA